ncbi:MAG TPA: hypothetical protein VJ183_18540 [Chloroflexia bacterium]|nr:hypothetical protein [Chloroflexia bacterium]
MGYLDVQSQFQQREKVKMEWRPWLLWVGATGVSHVAGSYLVGLIILASPISNDLPSLWVRAILSVLVTGAVVGLAQGVVLWKYMGVPIIRPWVLATAVGSGLGTGAILLYNQVSAPLLFSGMLCCLPLLVLSIAALFGALVGYAQRRVLELYLDAPTRWVSRNVLAGIVAILPIYIGVFWAILSLMINSSLELPSVWLISLLAGWLPSFLFGIVTGGEFLRVVHLYRAQR